MRQIGHTGAGTHLHPLIIAFLETTGKVIELGMGDFSTPILHELTDYFNRELVSYENNKEWFDNYRDLSHERSDQILVKDWDEAKAERCGLLFIDHAPAKRRAVDVERFKDLANVIICHDSEQIKEYNYHKVFPLFKYKYEYSRFTKKTILLSNKIDVREWFS